ncbi:hypothetical protein K502DRAFT_317098 [Neoconidiobolus thromboides FSU 785]|nr:hypothetical protein K502DRAFT_317098 [Neoconidiobolus thromboides FSU 785]
MNALTKKIILNGVTKPRGATILNQLSKYTSNTTNKAVLENIQKVKNSRPRSPFYAYNLYQSNMGASMGHRIGGVGLGLGFYAIVLAYPVLGLTSDVALEYLQVVPEPVKTGAKFIIAFPFMLHSFNGVRHLVWDAASGLTVKAVANSSYFVFGASLLSSIGLASL